MANMTAPALNTASLPDTTHSLSALNSLESGSIITIGSLCAQRTEKGWLIAGQRREHQTWSLVSMSGTTTATVLRRGQ